MEVVERPLTKREVKLLELGRISTNKEIVERLPINPLIFGSVILFFALQLLLQRWLPFWIILLVAIFTWTIIFWQFFWKREKVNAKRRGEKLDILLQKNTISVKRYSCYDALAFETWLDDRHIWALQIETNQVMIWSGSLAEYTGVLPAKQFDMIVDPDTKYFLGDTISNPTDPFPPTIVPATLVGNAAIDHLPVDKQGAILDTTLDKLLEDAKSWI